jgi:hypothetical protein
LGKSCKAEKLKVKTIVRRPGGVSALRQEISNQQSAISNQQSAIDKQRPSTLD